MKILSSVETMKNTLLSAKVLTTVCLFCALCVPLFAQVQTGVVPEQNSNRQQLDSVKTESQYDQLLRLDSTNLDILQEAANFYLEQHLYDKAMRACQKIIAHAQAEEWQIANAYRCIGELHTATGSLSDALKAYTQYFKTYEKLHKGNPTNTSYKENLSISNAKLGLTHTALGNLDKALRFFQNDNELMKELYSAYPQNVSFKNNLAISYQHLGITHTSLGNLDKALTFFEQCNELEKELYTAELQNAKFKRGLAISYQYLGITHTSLGNLNKALTFFEEHFRLSKELYSAYPQNVDFKNGLAISYGKLGEIHTSLGNLNKALTFFEQFNELRKELYKAYPQNVPFKNGLATSYAKLGERHMALGNLDKALTFFEQCNELMKELYSVYPQNVDFKNNLAISYSQLGWFFQIEKNDKTKALTYYLQCQTLAQELANDYPIFVEFQNRLKWAQNALAELEKEDDPISLLNTRIENEPDTLAKYQLYGMLCDTLRQMTMLDPQHKIALADALNARAWYGFFFQKFEAGEANIREGLGLHPENKYLPSNLAPALLLQGKKDAALVEYNKWKDLPFGEYDMPSYREIFLSDLNTLEKAGIIPAARRSDVAEVRKMLLKK